MHGTRTQESNVRMLVIFVKLGGRGQIGTVELKNTFNAIIAQIRRFLKDLASLWTNPMEM